MTDKTTYSSWAVVDVMGHRRYAGFMSEFTFAGHAYVRIDVPEVTRDGTTQPAFTKLIGPGSVYEITPCSEEVALAAAASSYTPALSEISLSEDLVRRKASQLGLVDPKSLPNAGLTEDDVACLNGPVYGGKSEGRRVNSVATQIEGRTIYHPEDDDEHPEWHLDPN